MTPLEQTVAFIKENENNTFQYEVDIGDPLFQSHAPYLELVINAPYAEMLAEAQALRERFVYHRPMDGKGWRSLCLHGISAERTGTPQEYGYTSDQVPYTWTEITNQCPVTVNYFKNWFPYDGYDRIRFMLLEPGGYIAPHRDNPQSFLGSAVNMSLNNPVDCKFATTAGLVPFKNTGSAFLFNTNYLHSVHNNSNEDRYHIIVHGNFKPEWKRLVKQSYKQALKKQVNPLQS
jgi:hypothetical protein